MITRSEFKQLIELIEVAKAVDDKLVRSLEAVYDGPLISRLNDNFYSAAKLFFTVIFGEEDADTIEWWMWENDFGKGTLGMWDALGHKIPMRTVDGLYNYLTKPR